MEDLPPALNPSPQATDNHYPQSLPTITTDNHYPQSSEPTDNVTDNVTDIVATHPVQQITRNKIVHTKLVLVCRYDRAIGTATHLHVLIVVPTY